VEQMAKNFLYTHTILDDRKGKICNTNELQEVHVKHKQYIESYLQPAIIAANCGWSDLQYLCVQYPGSDYLYPYMVLYVNDKPERWIPIDGNSDGCNLQVIGENLW
jgi:hypothetical protein